LEEKRRRNSHSHSRSRSRSHSHRRRRYWKGLLRQTGIIIIIAILVAMGLWMATAAFDISPGGGGQPARHHR
jgi:hypothetical protein